MQKSAFFPVNLNKPRATWMLQDPHPLQEQKRLPVGTRPGLAGAGSSVGTITCLCRQQRTCKQRSTTAELCQAPGTATGTLWGQLHSMTLHSPVKGVSDKVAYRRGFRAPQSVSGHPPARFPRLTAERGHGEHPDRAKAIPRTNPGCAL